MAFRLLTALSFRYVFDEALLFLAELFRYTMRVQGMFYFWSVLLMQVVQCRFVTMVVLLGGGAAVSDQWQLIVMLLHSRWRLFRHRSTGGHWQLQLWPVHWRSTRAPLHRHQPGWTWYIGNDRRKRALKLCSDLKLVVGQQSQHVVVVGGVMSQRRTCDQEVAGTTPDLGAAA